MTPPRPGRHYQEPLDLPRSRPPQRPYGTAAAMRDSSGNSLVLVERTESTGEDPPH